MRHHNSNRKFGRERNQRVAFLKSLANNLILHGKIKTTEARAKEIRPFVEKLISKGKEKTLASRKLIISRLGVRAMAKKLIDEISVKYEEKNGGYTRIIKLPPRQRDGSKMAVIEFV